MQQIEKIISETLEMSDILTFFNIYVYVAFLWLWNHHRDL